MCLLRRPRQPWTVRGLVVKCPTSAVRLMSARCSKISLIIHNRRVSIRSQQEITQFEYLLHKSCTLDVEEHLQCRLYTPGVCLLRRPRQPWTVRGLVVKCPTSAVRLMSARCSKISLIIHNRRVSIRSQQEITQFEYLLHKSCTLDVEEHLQCRLYTPLRHRDSVPTGAGV